MRCCIIPIAAHRATRATRNNFLYCFKFFDPTGSRKITKSEFSMRKGAAQKRGMQLALCRIVIDVTASPCHQPARIGARDGKTNRTAR